MTFHEPDEETPGPPPVGSASMPTAPPQHLTPPPFPGAPVQSAPTSPAPGVGEQLSPEEIALRVAAARRELGIDSVRKPSINKAAMLSLVLGIVGAGCFGLLTGVPAMVFGAFGLRKAASSGDGKIMSIVGIVAGLIGTIWSVAYIISLTS